MTSWISPCVCMYVCMYTCMFQDWNDFVNVCMHHACMNYVCMNLCVSCMYDACAICIWLSLQTISSLSCSLAEHTQISYKNWEHPPQAHAKLKVQWRFFQLKVFFNVDYNLRQEKTRNMITVSHAASFSVFLCHDVAHVHGRRMYVCPMVFLAEE